VTFEKIPPTSGRNENKKGHPVEWPLISQKIYAQAAGLAFAAFFDRTMAFLRLM